MKKIILMLACLPMFVFACKGSKNVEETIVKPPSSITKSSFGQTRDSIAVDMYTLKNANGMEVKIITYGGIITNWTAPDKNGKYEDIVLGFDSLPGYMRGSPYFGALIGRFGNRIAKGKFAINGEQYTLAGNNMGNHLHGGIKGFDKVVWKAEPMEGEEPALKLTYLSKDMEEGYPGNLNCTVIYTLTADNSVKIDYSATTDKETIVNLTNHSYFNLNANQGTILDHMVTLNSDKYLPVSRTLIPTGELRPVANTAFDFTTPYAVGARINDTTDQQIVFGGGYDHAFILKGDGKLNLAATVVAPSSGRKMEVFTTEPAIQFYSGNFLDGKLTGKNGVKYVKRSGLCLESEHYPDAPNQPAFPSTSLKPGETYKTTTVYKFSTVK
ncbi:MAG TPA: aldose epimerase family protein [Saprospiraceae bacterium]|nr:aldose epimerase family protein [Saprospiraceae bacterium]